MKPEPRDPHRDEFDALYQKHSREVWAVAYGRRMDADLALDIVQEAFLRLWRQYEAGETIQNPRAWLIRVARNLADDTAKSSFRRHGTLPPDHMNGVGSCDPLPLDRMVKHELFAQVRAVIEELPAADREILTLRYALDQDAPAIAELLGVHVSAIHMRLSRARQRLADRLAEHGVTHQP